MALLGRSTRSPTTRPAGTLPTVTEAEKRLEHLRAHGPMAQAFTFRQRFPAPGALEVPRLNDDLLGCPT
jgi:Domain of unknown function (DUF3291)